MSFTPSFRYSLNRDMISTFYMAPEKLAAVIASVSDRVMQSGAFTVHRINPDKLRDVLHPAPGAVPARIAADSAAFARAIDETVGEAVKTPRGVVRQTLGRVDAAGHGVALEAIEIVQAGP